MAVDHDLIHIVKFDARAKFFGLGLKFFDQLRAAQAFWEARIVLDVVGDGDLAAVVVAGDEQRGEIGARRIEACGEASRPAADDHDILDWPFAVGAVAICL